MAEPPTEVHGPPKQDDVPLSAGIGDASFRLADDPPTSIHQPGAAAAFEDTSPTIISRAARGPLRPDEAIAANLRGRRLAHFELQEAVGVGGMAAVIRAQDTQLERCVALKILPPQMAADPESIRRFHQEARSAARLDHENIARVFFCGEDQGLHFIAFEFVEGDNLRAILERRGQLPVSEAIHYMLQVATGLAHAAARGVVHRDIKPSNIIITPQGRAKLVDMGLARSLGPQTDDDLTQSGVTLGTFDYISPEQALEPRDADVRSDIYSLGCTFYHMLTGQPPVPEGTAAKKLHHHQHVAPIDPRQLNTEIPDDVAAVLARMMAKDPAQRYQRCEHLVQHLVQLAQKLGCAAEVPEGVHFIDAPLPSPPRVRPLLIAVAAAAVLVAVVGLLGTLSSSAPTGDVGFKFSRPRPAGGPTTSPEKSSGLDLTTKRTGPDTPVLPTRNVQVVSNLKDLTDALGKSASPHIQIGADIDLNDDGGDLPGLVFRGEELTLEPEEGKRPTIRLRHQLGGKEQQVWAALTILGGKATVRGLRFVVDAKGTQTLMSALVQRDGGSLNVSNCEFVQDGSARQTEQRHQAAIMVPAPGKEGAGRPSLSFERCFFRIVNTAAAQAEYAVAMDSPASLQFANCAFGPHLAVFSLRGSRIHDAEISLRHCSALLEPGAAALLLDNGPRCKWIVNDSLFSCPLNGPELDGDGAVLVRETGAQDATLRFEVERRNVYHNLASYWVREKPQELIRTVAATLEAFKRDTQVTGRTDPSIDLAASPWEYEKPLDWIAPRPDVSDKPWRAFAVNLKLRKLRCDDNPTRRVVGVEDCTWGVSYKEPLPEVEDSDPEVPVRKTKVVDPTVMESGRGIYPSLNLALGEAKPGDEILIRHNGMLEVEPIRLEKKTTDVTIRPARNCKPILTLGLTTDRDAALFRLHDGKLRFEDLEFALQPTRADFKAQCIVALVTDGQCTFKNCLVTLDPTHSVPVGLVTLVADPNGVMMMDPKDPTSSGARIRIEACFVRGSGDLLNVRASRPFSLEAEDSLVVLDGSFIVVDGNVKEAPVKPASQVSLKQVTAFLGEHLVCMRKEETKPVLVPLHVSQATGCLFHAARGNRTLVHVEGVETDEQMRRLFSWGQGKDNCYSNYTQFLDQVPPRGDNVMSPPAYDQEKWKTFAAGDTDGRYARVKFTSWPQEGRPLMQGWPSNFRVKEPNDLKGGGAPTDKLRTPSNQGESAPTSGEGE